MISYAVKKAGKKEKKKTSYRDAPAKERKTRKTRKETSISDRAKRHALNVPPTRRRYVRRFPLIPTPPNLIHSPTRLSSIPPPHHELPHILIIVLGIRCGGRLFRTCQHSLVPSIPVPSQSRAEQRTYRIDSSSNDIIPRQGNRRPHIRVRSSRLIHRIRRGRILSTSLLRGDALCGLCLHGCVPRRARLQRIRDFCRLRRVAGDAAARGDGVSARGRGSVALVLF